jgi:hypothetical protein
MSRHRNPKAAQKKIRAVIVWARRAGFHNLTCELQDALSLLPSEDEGLTVGVKQMSRR